MGKSTGVLTPIWEQNSSVQNAGGILNAIEKGKVTKGHQPEHRNRDEGRTATETGHSHCNVKGWKIQKAEGTKEKEMMPWQVMCPFCGENIFTGVKIYTAYCEICNTEWTMTDLEIYDLSFPDPEIMEIVNELMKLSYKLAMEDV